ncbi:unnamed protein product [Mytilus edulis]|uniref:C-type lectin domain-containing protein n=1 Tax=Mytilus edulis TaxID=6550 RepID=A0A8S3RTE2_MYTED|nr:unnamed protein product [Mytilus edulis]
MVFVHCERVSVNPPDYIMKQTLEELYAVVELVEDHTTSAHCHRYDSSLVEVPDTNKTDALKSLLESQYTNRHTTVDKFFWIGGYGHDGDFIWKSTGSLITFQNWNKGNPLPVPGRHYEELCLEMVQSSDFKWNYALCNATNPFVCERKKN